MMHQTISQLLQLAQQKNIDILDAELLIAHVLKKPREFVIAHSEQKINETKKQKIKWLIEQRANGVPLAYLTGHKEFYGLDFIVNKHTLIPRPETELMVDLAIRKLQNAECRMQNTILVDVGTGSGCIPIAILKMLNRNDELSLPRRNSSSTHFVTPATPKCFAIDISQPALSVAKKNAKKHQVKIKFLHGNILSKFPISNFQFPNKSQTSNSQIIITANLPYLTPKQFSSEPSIHHEPRLALVAGQDGLKYYRQLFKQIKLLITDYCLLITVYCEIDPSQTSSIKKLIKQHLPNTKITIHKDLADKNRVVEISY